MVSVVSEKITRKSPTRKRFASTPTNGFTLLACDDASSAYCLILVRACAGPSSRFAYREPISSVNYLIKRYKNQSLREIFSNFLFRSDQSKSQRHPDMARLESQPHVESLGVDAAIVRQKFD
jgi:hypothetical protein